MGLQIWLPLTQDINNQGLLDLPTPYDFRVRDTGGKIGQYCYTDGAIYHIDQEWLGNHWSLACWIKSSSWGTYNDIILCKNTDSSESAQFYFSIIGGSRFNIGCNAGSQTLTVNYTFAQNTWYHVAATYNGNTLKLYLNGSEIGTKAYTSNQKMGMNNLCIGCRSSNTSGTQATGNTVGKRMNDVRIYDHALSPREVKEIAKGLVLHYPLNREGFGVDNLLADTDFNGISKKFTLQSGSEGGFWFPPTIWERSTEYTVSCKLRGNANMNLYLISSGGNQALNWVNRENLSPTDYKFFSITFTSRNDRDVSNLFICTRYGTNNSSVGDWFEIKPYSLKLEKGSVSTPWTPNPSDTLYSQIGLDNNIEYDVSGYGHNGTKVGTITYDADTPRYNVCSALTHSTDRIQITRPPYSVGQYINQISISIWFKTDQSNGDGSNFFSLGQNNFIRARIPRNATSSIWTYLRYQSSTLATVKDVGKELTDNTWHHFVFVWNNGIQYFYLDGVLAATSDNSSTTTQLYYSLESTWMLGGYNSTAEYFIGFLSDFRVYSTALSASDILELYHTPVTLSNNGTLMTQGEYVEV